MSRTGPRQVLVIVHPDDPLVFDAARIACIEGFAGTLAVLLFGTRRPGQKVQQGLQAPIASLAARGLRIATVSNAGFGNQRGLPLPIDAAFAVLRTVPLLPDDRLLLTGMRSGEQPGSVHLLTEAFAALHFDVKAETGPAGLAA